MQILNYLIDVFFFLDVIINFRTSYFETEKGIEIMDGKRAAYHYMKTRFAVDLIASIPFDYISLFLNSDSNSLLLKMFSLLKLVRILRLGRLITHLNIKNELKNSLKLVKLIFFVWLFIH